MKNRQIAIIMGSKSDEDQVKKAITMLQQFDIGFSVNVYSAHRNPFRLDDFIKDLNNDSDCEVIIACAGMSAALAGHIAAITIKPVIGVPLSSAVLDGMDALLSTAQMPPGIPVATVGIDATRNAALLALQIIAGHDSDVREKLLAYRRDQDHQVSMANQEISEKYSC